jgi:hypothetical protein
MLRRFKQGSKMAIVDEAQADEHHSKSAKSSHVSIVCDESKLAQLDVANGEIKAIIKETSNSVCHSPSKPIRESIKPKLGVTYREFGKKGA